MDWSGVRKSRLELVSGVPDNLGLNSTFAPSSAEVALSSPCTFVSLTADVSLLAATLPSSP